VGKLVAAATVGIVWCVSAETTRCKPGWPLYLNGVRKRQVAIEIGWPLGEHDLPILMMRSVDYSLEEIFIQLTGRRIREEM